MVESLIQVRTPLQLEASKERQRAKSVTAIKRSGTKTLWRVWWVVWSGEKGLAAEGASSGSWGADADAQRVGVAHVVHAHCEMVVLMV